jgi:DnaJ-class molecular chaperone
MDDTQTFVSDLGIVYYRNSKCAECAGRGVDGWGETCIRCAGEGREPAYEQIVEPKTEG